MTAAAIQAIQLTKQYAKVRALDNLNLEIPEIVLIAEMKEHPKQDNMATATPSMSPLPESTPAENQREKEDSHDSYKNGESGGSGQSNSEGGGVNKQREKEEDEDKADGSNSGGHTP